jgi:hypothetical protein
MQVGLGLHEQPVLIPIVIDLSVRCCSSSTAARLNRKNTSRGIRIIGNPEVISKAAAFGRPQTPSWQSELPITALTVVMLTLPLSARDINEKYLKVPHSPYSG